MKLKDKFNLSHVAGFFVGVVITVIFNWIVFKDPKRITAPGVAALVAICTFTLALWSAFKVENWLKSKVNDEAFNRTLKILELIEGFHGMLQPLTSSISDIMSSEYQRDDQDKLKKEKTRVCINEIYSLGSSFMMKIKTLQYWNVKFTDDASIYLSTIQKELIDLVKNCELILQHVEINSTPVNDELRNNANTNYLKISAAIIQITSLSYDEIFNKDSFTSFSKKVDQ